MITPRTARTNKETIATENGGSMRSPAIRASHSSKRHTCLELTLFWDITITAPGCLMHFLRYSSLLRLAYCCAFYRSGGRETRASRATATATRCDLQKGTSATTTRSSTTGGQTPRSDPRCQIPPPSGPSNLTGSLDDTGDLTLRFDRTSHLLIYWLCQMTNYGLSPHS